jgi:hypothetical protein
MSKTKNQSVKLNKVVLTNLPNVGVLVVEKVGVAGTKDDKRTSNPGRPVNKQSARYKRLAKQAFYAKQKNQFECSKTFTYKNKTYIYECNDDGYGYICDYNNRHVCNVSYIGRTKVLGYAFVLDRRVNVEINLKQVKFIK